jgi:hypothetical protein
VRGPTNAGPLRSSANGSAATPLTPVVVVVVVVEVAGIEPASFDGSSGLLRVQPAVHFSAPAVTQASCRRAQSLFDVLQRPVTERWSEPPSRRQDPRRKHPRSDGLQLCLSSESEVSALRIGTCWFPRNG